jgi:hypothetical protein
MSGISQARSHLETSYNSIIVKLVKSSLGSIPTNLLFDNSSTFNIWGKEEGNHQWNYFANQESSEN